MLHATAAERVVDPMFLLFAGEIRFGDEVLAAADTKSVARAAECDGASGEIAFDGVRGGPLQHLAVPAALPCLMNLPVTGRACLRPDVT